MATVAKTPSVQEQLLYRAELLAEVYNALPDRLKALDTSAIPPENVGPTSRIGNVGIRGMIHVLGIDRPELFVRVRKVPVYDQGAREQIYSDSFHTVIPRVREATAKAAAVTLDQRVRELMELSRRFSQPGIAERLHQIAERVRSRVRVFAAADEDYRGAEKALGRGRRRGQPDRDFDHKQTEMLYKRVAAAFAAEIPRQPSDPKDTSGAEVRKLCLLLTNNPFLIEIMERYDQSAGVGDRYIHRLLDEAMAATAAFDAQLRLEPDHLWRYQMLIAMGVKQLGFDRVDGFAEYIAGLRPVFTKDPVDDVLFVLGLVIIVASVVATGPLGVAAAAGSVGASGALVGLALADFSVTVAGAAKTYYEERQQDLAAISGNFSKEQIASRPSYGRTGLALAAVFLSGLALVRSGSKFVKDLRGEKPGAPRPPGSAARTRRTPDPKGLSSPSTGYRARLNERTRVKADPHRGLPSKPDGDPAKAMAAGAPDPPPVSSERPWLKRPKPGSPGDELAPVASSGSRKGAGSPADPVAPGGGSKATAGKGTADTGTRSRAWVTDDPNFAELADPRFARRLRLLKTPDAWQWFRSNVHVPAVEIDPKILEMARRMRARAGITLEDFSSTNVAAAKVRIGGAGGEVRYIATRNTRAAEIGAERGYDSEQLIFDEIQDIKNQLERLHPGRAPKVELIQLYTERIPCDNCANWLNEVPFTEAAIFYTVRGKNVLGNLTRGEGLMNAFLIR